MNDTQFIADLYDGFNKRDIDAVLSRLAEDVAWANGMDGGHLHGRDAVKTYWIAQWTTIDPHVEPQKILQNADGSFTVEVRQVVHDLKGNCLLDEVIRHVFHLRNDLVYRFDINSESQLSSIVHAGE